MKRAEHLPVKRRRRRVVLPLLGILVALVAVLPLRDREASDREAFIAAHPEVARSFADLSRGTTHHEHVSGHGPLVVLVHGVSGPMSVWDEMCLTLQGAQRAYLRLDLYGRGASSRLSPPTYDLVTYRDQVAELVDRVAPGEPVHLVGSSMGALIVAEVARQFGARVRSVVLVGPAGFPLQATPAARALGVPLLGEWAMKSFGDDLLAKHQRRYFVAPERFESQHALFDAQLRVRGTKRAILETTRRVPLQDYAAGYRALAALTRPVLVFWGREDRAFPFAHEAELRVYVPTATFIAVDGAGHLPQLERADILGPRLLGWLVEHDGVAASGDP
jgi:pimeloyl-ACP methyl ester carboxylesterase